MILTNLLREVCDLDRYRSPFTDLVRGISVCDLCSAPIDELISEMYRQFHEHLYYTVWLLIVYGAKKQ